MVFGGECLQVQVFPEHTAFASCSAGTFTRFRPMLHVGEEMLKLTCCCFFPGPQQEDGNLFKPPAGPVDRVQHRGAVRGPGLSQESLHSQCEGEPPSAKGGLAPSPDGCCISSPAFPYPGLWAEEAGALLKMHFSWCHADVIALLLVLFHKSGFR